MEGKLDEILNGLPEKPPRSCLESFHDFIDELRRRRHTYRDIAKILEEKCQLRVSKSTGSSFPSGSITAKPQIAAAPGLSGQ